MTLIPDDKNNFLFSSSSEEFINKILWSQFQILLNLIIFLESKIYLHFNNIFTTLFKPYQVHAYIINAKNLICVFSKNRKVS